MIQKVKRLWIYFITRIADLDFKDYKKQQKKEVRKTQQQKQKIADEQERDLASREQSHLMSLQNEMSADIRLKQIMQTQYSQAIENAGSRRLKGTLLYNAMSLLRVRLSARWDENIKV